WSNLFGVSCVSPSACEAVGATVSRSREWRPVMGRWNGTKWQLQPPPSPGASYLGGVSSTPPTACTAGGRSAPRPPARGAVGAVGRQQLAGPADSQPGWSLPGRRRVHVALGLHRRRRL